ncbi:MAG TPA: hypothetical protein VLT33_50000 [Labilithrix sp.]|nr:hypothetical protein [Labilithrix sp.]
MPRSHVLFVIVALATAGCTASSPSLRSPAKAATSCTQGTGDAQAERECLRHVLDDLAGLDPSEERAPRATFTASRTPAR